MKAEFARFQFRRPKNFVVNLDRSGGGFTVTDLTSLFKIESECKRTITQIIYLLSCEVV